jgi:two-component system LytT family response regulator
MIKTILVDDEPRLLSSLNNMLEQYCPQVQVLALCKNAEEAYDTITGLQPDLVFLDISMPGKSAFELLSSIDDISFEIIFVTAHPGYMEKAFKFSAIDYLLKPVDEDELISAVLRAEKRIREQSFRSSMESLLHNMQKTAAPGEMKLCVPVLNGLEIINISNIIFCEADGAYTNFHLSDGKRICVCKPLLDYEQLLHDKSFLRIHKSHLVNTQHIKKYIRGEGGTVVMSNGFEIPVSRRKKEHFLSSIRESFSF